MAVELQLPEPPANQPGTRVVVGRGARRELGGLLRDAFGRRPYLVAGDERVVELWLDDLGLELPRGHLTVPAGEAAKTPEVLAGLVRALASRELPRDGYLVALGGGAAGDVVGLAAATYLRGVPVVQVPTSLLAMVDAGLGGKCAVNLPEGKNFFGAFHAPALMLVDPEFLETLPEVEMRSGFGEVAKYAIGFSARLAASLESGKAAIEDTIATCVRIKADVVGPDPFERSGGRRVLLNLGHTSAHALESWAAARGHVVPHGLAVAWGLRVACRVAVAKGLQSDGERARSDALLDRLSLPRAACDLVPDAPDPDELLAFAQRDKKRLSGALRMVLPVGLGSCEAREVADGELGDVLGGPGV